MQKKIKKLKTHYKLKDICEIGGGLSKYNLKYALKNPGIYPVYGGSVSKTPKCYINSFDYNGTYICFIGVSSKEFAGKFLYFKNKKFSISSGLKILNKFKINLNLKYLYFFLNQINIKKYLVSVGLGAQLRNDEAYDIDILIPSLNIQNYFVKKLWFLEESFSELKNLKIQLHDIKRKLLRYCFEKHLNDKKDSHCKLKKVCETRTGDIKLSKKYCKKNKGPYSVYSSSNTGPFAYINYYKYVGNFIWMIRKGPPYQGKSFYIKNQKFSLTSDAILLKIKKLEKNLDLKYLYFYLSFQQKNIQHILTVGTALKRINIDDLQKYPIQIPSLSIQSKIIQFLSSYDLIDPVILKIDNFLNSYSTYKKTLLKIIFNLVK